MFRFKVLISKILKCKKKIILMQQQQLNQNGSKYNQLAETLSLGLQCMSDSNQAVHVGDIYCFIWAYSKPDFLVMWHNLMSRIMRKPAFCICENKDADQLRGFYEADQCICSCHRDSTMPLLLKSEISRF